MANQAVDMVALRSWTNTEFGEHNIRKGKPFQARDTRRADELEAGGLAARSTAKAIKQGKALATGAVAGGSQLDRSELNPTQAAASPAAESGSSSEPVRPRRAKTGKPSSGRKKRAKR